MYWVFSASCVPSQILADGMRFWACAWSYWAEDLRVQNKLVGKNSLWESDSAP